MDTYLIGLIYLMWLTHNLYQQIFCILWHISAYNCRSASGVFPDVALYRSFEKMLWGGPPLHSFWPPKSTDQSGLACRWLPHNYDWWERGSSDSRIYHSCSINMVIERHWSGWQPSSINLTKFKGSGRIVTRSFWTRSPARTNTIISPTCSPCKIETLCPGIFMTNDLPPVAAPVTNLSSNIPTDAGNIDPLDAQVRLSLYLDGESAQTSARLLMNASAWCSLGSTRSTGPNMRSSIWSLWQRACVSQSQLAFATADHVLSKLGEWLVTPMQPSMSIVHSLTSACT